MNNDTLDFLDKLSSENGLQPLSKTLEALSLSIPEEYRKTVMEQVQADITKAVKEGIEKTNQGLKDVVLDKDTIEKIKEKIGELDGTHE